MSEQHISRAGVLLAVILAVASIGVLMQDTALHAATPSVVNAQTAQPDSGNTSLASTMQRNQNGVSSQSRAATRSPESKPDTASTASNGVGASQQLPQTSTILPLLGLIGLGSLVAGLFARR